MQPYQFGDGINDLIERVRGGASLDDAVLEQEAEAPALAARANRDVAELRKGNRDTVRGVSSLEILRQLVGDPPAVEEAPGIVDLNKPPEFAGHF